MQIVIDIEKITNPHFGGYIYRAKVRNIPVYGEGEFVKEAVEDVADALADHVHHATEEMVIKAVA